MGGQVIYDDDRDITWLANANLAASNTFGLPIAYPLGKHPLDSSGLVDGYIYANGAMNWSGAQNITMTDAGNCPDYNLLPARGFYPDSAGRWIDIAGKSWLVRMHKPRSVRWYWLTGNIRFPAMARVAMP